MSANYTSLVYIEILILQKNFLMIINNKYESSIVAFLVATASVNVRLLTEGARAS